MTKLDKIQHPSHPEHPIWQRPIETLYKCDGCKQLGFESCYRCKRCDYQLHKECARACPNDVAYHSFFPKRVLVFRDHTPCRVRPCQACGDGVPGFRYKAWHQKAHGSANPFWLLYQHITGTALHPTCANLPSSLNADNSGELVLRLVKDKKRSSCKICNNEEFARGVKGWAYESSSGRIRFHVSCVKKMLEEEWDRKSAEKRIRRRIMAVKIGLGVARLALELVVTAILGFPSKLMVDFLFNNI